MRTRCGRARRQVVELVGPELQNRADVVAALRLSAASPEERTVVVLVCDGEERIVLALDFAGAGVTDLAAVVELVSVAVHDRPGLHLVVGIFRGTESAVLDDDETAAVAELITAADIAVRDVIVLATSGDGHPVAHTGDEGLLE